VPSTEPTEDGGAAVPGAGPARLERDPGSGVSLVYQSEAVDAIAIGGRVVVLEPDFMHLHGVEPGSGEIVWRRRIQRDPDGAHTLHADDYRVLVHGGRKLVVVDARDGRILGRNDDVPPYAARTVEIHDGACAFAGPCDVLPFDCATAAWPGTTSTPSQDTASCDVPPRLLGRAGGDVIVRRGPGDAPGTTRLAAFGPTGGEHWTVDVAMQPDLDGGVVPQLDAVWIHDAAAVAVVRGSNGQVRWRAELGFSGEQGGLHDGLVVVAGHEGRRPTIAAWDVASGQPRWRRRLRGRRVPLLDTAQDGPWHGGGVRVYELMSSASGESMGRMAAARDETLWRAADGGYVRTNGDFEELSARGEIRRQRPHGGGEVLAIGATHVVSKAGTEVRFFDRIALRERARLLGGFELDPSSRALGPHRVLMRRPTADGVTVVILGLQPRGRRRSTVAD
jgi:hypothetical protein